MKVIIQRVSEASVKIKGKIKSSIKSGLLILVGFEDKDNELDVEWITKKTVNLRIFDDENGVMNRSVIDIDGEILVISQFTLHASTKKGNRPSYILAAKPDHAIPLYEKYINELKNNTRKEVFSGEFGADMKVNLINDGPVTIIIDSQNKF